MKKTFKRPEWDEYFIQIAHVVKTRSNCIRGRVGALIVKNKQILATGYNGTPSGIKNCFEGGCKRCWNRQTGKLKSGEKKDTCICLHAEQNALAQAARFGVELNGGTLYCKMTPCHVCAKLIISAGIKRVVAENDYQKAKMTKNIFKKSGVKLEILNKKVMQYKK